MIYQTQEVSKEEVPRSLPREGVPHDDQSIWPSVGSCNPAPVFTHTQARNDICVALGNKKQQSAAEAPDWVVI